MMSYNNIHTECNEFIASLKIQIVERDQEIAKLKTSLDIAYELLEDSDRDLDTK